MATNPCVPRNETGGLGETKENYRNLRLLYLDKRRFSKRFTQQTTHPDAKDAR